MRLPGKLNVINVKNGEGYSDTSAEIAINNEVEFPPKISVVLPIYNVEKHLAECLESVINQSIKDIEIICVDDGSCDNSLEILKQYASRDKRITVLRQKNSNAGVARNAGMSIAKGEYVGFIDSDDYILPSMYAKLYDKAATQQLDISICEYVGFDTNTRDVLRTYGIAKGYVKRCLHESADTIRVQPGCPLFQITNPAPWNKIFRRSLLTKNDIYFQPIVSSNDVAFTNTALSCASRIGLITEKLYCYRMNMKNSLTGRRDANLYCFYDAIKELHARLVRRGKFEDFRESFTNAVVAWCKFNYDKVNDKNKKRLEKLFIEEIFPKYNISKSLLATGSHPYDKSLNKLQSAILKISELICHSRTTVNYKKIYLFGVQVFKKKLTHAK